MLIDLTAFLFVADSVGGPIFPRNRRREFWKPAKSGVAMLAILVALPLRGPAQQSPVITTEDRKFIEDMERRGVLYFWEQSDPSTGLVRDRASADGGPTKGPSRDIASLAATGFGLTALCIGSEHGWIPRDQVHTRVRTTLEFFASKAYQEHG